MPKGKKSFRYTTNVQPFQDIIKELANELTYNHLANSFSDNRGEEIHCHHIFDSVPFSTDDPRLPFEPGFFGPSPSSPAAAFKHRKNHGLEKSCRNIVVIGTGASHDSYAFVPLGSDMTNNLEELLLNDIPRSAEVRKKYAHDKQNIQRLLKGAFDFENCLSLLSNYIVPDTLRAKIKEMTAFRHEPCLFYEIIAHLFKHNFIDVIINFNFDELLDHALEEEVGLQNYHHILHDGDCIAIKSLTEDGRLKVPVYIKPHGTYSHSTSLRFTKQHYLDVSPEIKNLLEMLIGGQREGNSNPIQRVNLICVGFDLTSLEFNEILDRNLPPQSRIYHIAYENYSKDRLKILREEYLAHFFKRAKDEKNATCYQTVEIKNFTPSDKLISPYAELFLVLWREINSNFSSLYRPRSIGRHELLNYLFYRNTRSKEPDSYLQAATQVRETGKHLWKYLVDRLLVEIAIVLNRSHGLVDVIHLLNGRIGKYYALYCEQATLCDNDRVWSIYELLGEFTRERELLGEGDQDEFIYSRNVFRMMPFSQIEFEQWLDTLFSSHHYNDAPDLFKSMLREEFEDVHHQHPITASILLRLFTSDKLSNYFVDRLLADYEKVVRNGLIWEMDGKAVKCQKPLLNEIFRIFVKSAPHNYFSIRSPHNSQIDRMWESFDRRNLLRTALAYKHHFLNQFMKKSEWDVLLCVSESGGFIDSLPIPIKSPGIYPEYSGILEQLQAGKKRLIMICSHETVRQKHSENGEDLDVQALIKRHKVHLANGGLWNIDSIDLLLLPSWQHNHHSILFLKGVPKGGNTQDDNFPFYALQHDVEQGFLFSGSYYYYKKGFSYSFYPQFFPKAQGNTILKQKVKGDQLKLLSLFYTYVSRSIVFLNEVNADESWFDQLKPCFREGTTLAEYRRYTLWKPEEFKEHMNRFISHLHRWCFPTT